MTDAQRRHGSAQPIVPVPSPVSRFATRRLKKLLDEICFWLDILFFSRIGAAEFNHQ
jgi:hypothetical protein